MTIKTITTSFCRPHLSLATQARQVETMHRGYVKLFRKTADNGLMKNAQLLQFWVWCLLKANHKPGYEDMIGRQTIPLEQGQFIFGRKIAAEALKSTEMKIRGCLAALEKAGCLSVKVTNKFSIVTVCNWLDYQSSSEDEQPTSNQQVTNKQPTSNHIQEQRTKNKEQRKEKDTRFDARLYLSERGVLDQHVADWLKIRKEKKTPPTLTALRLTESEALKAGMSLAEAVKTCCEEGWAGFKAEWIKKGAQNGTNRGGVGKGSGGFGDARKSGKTNWLG